VAADGDAVRERERGGRHQLGERRNEKQRKRKKVQERDRNKTAKERKRKI
jgi:hypothetical protein